VASDIVGSNSNHGRQGLQDTYIAIGSNIGDRAEAFRDAITQLRLIGDVKCTSFLYETPPMYVTDQAKFLNAACHLQTSLKPDELLTALKSIGKRFFYYSLHLFSTNSSNLFSLRFKSMILTL
jgi:hypothetical protein